MTMHPEGNSVPVELPRDDWSRAAAMARDGLENVPSEEERRIMLTLIGDIEHAVVANATADATDDETVTVKADRTEWFRFLVALTHGSPHSAEEGGWAWNMTDAIRDQAEITIVESIEINEELRRRER